MIRLMKLCQFKINLKTLIGGLNNISYYSEYRKKILNEIKELEDKLFKVKEINDFIPFSMRYSYGASEARFLIEMINQKKNTLRELDFQDYYEHHYNSSNASQRGDAFNIMYERYKPKNINRRID
jgi:hypothetical protein